MPGQLFLYRVYLAQVQCLVHSRVLEAFLETQRPIAVRVLQSLCGSRDDAEDMVQDVSMEFFTRFSTRSLPANPVAYWLTMLRRAPTGQYRRQAKHVPLDEQMYHLEDPAPSPEDQAEIAEARRRVQQALGNLQSGTGKGGSQAAILLLQHVEGLSQAEIADRLGLDPATVKSRAHDGRRKLERSLGPYFEDSRATARHQS